VICSPDGSEKPCAEKTDFFLMNQSEQRKLLGQLRKNSFCKQACSGQREMSAKITTELFFIKSANQWQKK
jgi:hypothetical protein